MKKRYRFRALCASARIARGNNSFPSLHSASGDHLNEPQHPSRRRTISAHSSPQLHHCGGWKMKKYNSFSAPPARILGYLYRVYAYKTSFLSFLAPQAKIFSFRTSSNSDFVVKMMISKGKLNFRFPKFSQIQLRFCCETRGVS